MASDAVAMTAEDEALLDRVAERIVELHVEVPAILTLETSRPLSVLAGQTLFFFEPIVTALFRFRDYRRFAQLIERRETIEALIVRIEERAEAAHRARREAKRARAAARPTRTR